MLLTLRFTRTSQPKRYKEMILDIDNLSLVQNFVKKLTEGWFDIDNMYHELKAGSQTNWTEFWNITDSMINTVSDYLKCSSEYFVSQWNKKCSLHGAMVKGYHCTRHSNKSVFLEKGILPLSEKTVNPLKNQKQLDASKIWNYRSTVGAGPYLCLSYKSAKDPNNHFFNGPEILLGLIGNQPGINHEKSIPLILHCEIPFSILTNKKFYIFCALKAYLNFLDPEDGTEDLFEGASIDLNGNPLAPKYIVRIEEIE